MKITGTGSLQSSSPIRRKGSAGQEDTSGFAGEIASDSPARGSAAVADVGTPAMLLSIQELADPLAERRRAIRRGEDILARLDELRHGLLLGTLPRDRLDSLLVLVRRQQDRVVDPRLREVLREIEVRASVELAKLGRLA